MEDLKGLALEMYKVLCSLKELCIRHGHRPGMGKVKGQLQALDWEELAKAFAEKEEKEDADKRTFGQ